MLRRFFCISISIILILSGLCVQTVAAPQLSAQSAIVMVAATGQVLFEKNAYEKRGIASTTKIMTSIVAIENADLFSTTIATAKDVCVEGTSLGIKQGDRVELLTLLKGMLLESGNDAANVTATLVAGGKEAFAQLMNAKASQLGMKYTCFKNPSGLPEEEHYSCAYDMALLGSYAIKNKVFRDICSVSKCQVALGNAENIRTLYNHNKLLSKYDGALGIKTGFTKASGRCLVSAVERNGVVLVAVTLNASDDWNDHIKLYDYCFPLISVERADNILQGVNVHIVNSDKKSLRISLSDEVFIPYKDKAPKYIYNVYIPRFIYAPVKTGDYIGWVEACTSEGILIKKAYIVSNENIDSQKSEPKEAFIEKILKFIVKDRR